MTLREDIQKLAKEKPEMRKHLLPLLRKAAWKSIWKRIAPRNIPRVVYPPTNNGPSRSDILKETEKIRTILERKLQDAGGGAQAWAKLENIGLQLAEKATQRLLQGFGELSPEDEKLIRTSLVNQLQQDEALLYDKDFHI